MAQKYGKWINQKQLSEGGQGKTYIVVEEGAEDKGEFVLKRYGNNPDRIHRYRNEVSAGLQLSHPNVIKVEDSNLDNDPYFIVTEYCRGGALSKADLSSYSFIERLRLFAEICRGVAHAHSKGIVHRDIKPANIFLKDKYTPVIGDFGICFITDEDRGTELHEWVGDRNIIAPELEGGRLELVEPTADVYSLGKLLYWLISGRPISRERHREPAFDLTKDAKGSEIIFAYELLDKMIVYEPSGRFADASEVLESVENAIKRILMYAHPIDVTASQHCLYCGIGTYQIVLNSKTAYNRDSIESTLRQFGFEPRTDQPWLIFVCDYCGNMQIFRPGSTKNPDVWWQKK